MANVESSGPAHAGPVITPSYADAVAQTDTAVQQVPCILLREATEDSMV